MRCTSCALRVLTLHSRLAAGLAVNGFPNEVGVAIVASVLLNHVQENPAEAWVAVVIPLNVW